ncbi:energy transducer TonB [Salegentibacter flavus]|uniref:Protein TonB n=1 Tax=Salegentibacter flavus TaxID=287099 RepID=A0A1I5D0H4_9FLAO|nr:energy transducer TonB [Salegentibacter flavus]SFN92714.1 protein TonB [Salegentibacter flavus]
MQVKKNAKADLASYSMIFFQVGLILVLAATYIGLEWKFTEQDQSILYEVEVADEDTEEIPITQLDNLPPPPPPPPPPAPEMVQIIEDDLDVEEDLIQSTETNQDAKVEMIIPVSAVEYEEEEEEVENVPFMIVEEVPVFPGCETIKDKDEQKKCLNDKIHALYAREFNTEIGAELELTGFYRIYVGFKINEKGEVAEIQTRGPHRRLEAEAERVAKLIPKMAPGKQRGRPVSVGYSLPVVFEMRPSR